MPSSPPSKRRDYGIAIISALPLEAHAVKAVFDEVVDAGRDEDSDSDSDGEGGKPSWDSNVYSTGKIGGRSVVLAHMPGMGKAYAAGVAVYLKSSFPNIKLALIVGICGGVPKASDRADILLGDVVISTSVVQYDLVREYPEEHERKHGQEDNLGRPNPEIRAFTNKLQARKGELEEETSKNIATVLEKPGFESAGFPVGVQDKLFEADYPHKHHVPEDCETASCFQGDKPLPCKGSRKASCEKLKCNGVLVSRDRVASAQQPVIHFGPIGSGDRVIKSGESRDEIAKKEGIIAFEMEAAGAWDYLPCLVVKGVCDYADSHKNKEYQPYVAAAAGSCLKAVLAQWVTADKQSGEEKVKFERFLPPRPASGAYLAAC
jgi:nucleoside phosphorylase